MSRSIWLITPHAIFLSLCSAGFPIAKLGLKHAPPLALLALRYKTVLLILLAISRNPAPAPPQSANALDRVAMVGVLIQVVYFVLCYGHPPESKWLHKKNFLGKMDEEISNEDNQIH